MQFSKQKHAYVMMFPWNYPEIIEDFEGEMRTLSNGSFWSAFMKSNALNEINVLFREFHQSCALQDYKSLNRVCEGTLAVFYKCNV